MGSKETARWKNAERRVAELLTEAGIESHRITRAGNYAISDFDVEINGKPQYKNDSKYSAKGFTTSRLLEVVREKYCKEPGDIPILWCKAFKERNFKVTIDSDFFLKLFKCWLDHNG